jgi:hypothetical protein
MNYWFNKKEKKKRVNIYSEIYSISYHFRNDNPLSNFTSFKKDVIIIKVKTQTLSLFFIVVVVFKIF